MSIAPKPLGHVCEHCGRSNLLMQIPEWSSERPTQLGWYWMLEEISREEQVVRITAGMRVHRNHDQHVYSLDSGVFDNCQWRPVL